MGNRQVRVCADVSGRIANRQVSDQFCKPICKPDAAGQAETGETQKAGDDLAPYVCRGQYGDMRPPETAETRVVWLITQRSRVQIPPPLPRPEAGSEQGSGLWLVVRARVCVHSAQRLPLTLPQFLVILLTMTVLPLGDVKSHLSELVGRVHDHHERVTVTVHGKPSAILIAPEDLEALEETLAIMRDAATMNRLAESDAELARGEYVSAEELAETMRRRRAS